MREEQALEKMGEKWVPFLRWSTVLRGPAYSKMKLELGGWVGLSFIWTSSG